MKDNMSNQATPVLSRAQDNLDAHVNRSAYEPPEVNVQRISLVTQGGSVGTEDSDPPNTGLPG